MINEEIRKSLKERFNFNLAFIEDPALDNSILNADLYGRLIYSIPYMRQELKDIGYSNQECTDVLYNIYKKYPSNIFTSEKSF